MTKTLTCALIGALTLVLGLPAAAEAKNRWIERETINIAHQGGEDEFPSNTMYAFRKAVAAGADMLELDIGVTKDNQVIVMHDTTVDGKTNGSGTVASFSLRRLKRLDAAHWFAPRARDHYSHDLRRKAYRFRGIATGNRKPPKGFRAADFRVPTLREVMRAFPRTPINIEIKGRTPAETDAEYVQNAEVLAALLEDTKRRDLIVVSFKQPAVDRFHELVPRSIWRPASPAWPTGCSAGGLPVRAWRRSRCRSPSGSPGRCSTSPPRRTSRGHTPRATRGRTGSRATTGTRRPAGASWSTCAWTAS